MGNGGGRAWDLRAPPRCGQLAWGWGVTASSPRRHRHRAAAAAIREVRGCFLLPAQRGRRSEAGSTPVFSPPPPVATCGCWEPRLASPGVGQKRCPLGPGRCSQVGLDGQAVPRPQPALGPRVRAAGEWGDVNLGRIVEGVEGQRDPTLKRA